MTRIVNRGVESDVTSVFPHSGKAGLPTPGYVRDDKRARSRWFSKKLRVPMISNFVTGVYQINGANKAYSDLWSAPAGPGAATLSVVPGQGLKAVGKTNLSAWLNAQDELLALLTAKSSSGFVILIDYQLEQPDTARPTVGFEAANLASNAGCGLYHNGALNLDFYDYGNVHQSSSPSPLGSCRAAFLYSPNRVRAALNGAELSADFDNPMDFTIEKLMLYAQIRSAGTANSTALIRVVKLFDAVAAKDLAELSAI